MDPHRGVPTNHVGFSSGGDPVYRTPGTRAEDAWTQTAPHGSQNKPLAGGLSKMSPRHKKEYLNKLAGPARNTTD